MAPNAAPKGGLAWYARPAIMLPAVGVLIVIAALATPQATGGRTGDERLSSYSTAPMGAALFFEMAERLGWNTEQRREPSIPSDTDAIVAELAPAVPLRPADVHALLERVRRGGAMLAMLDAGSTVLADSLHVAVGPGHTRVRHARDEVEGCPAERRNLFRDPFLTTLWVDDTVRLTTISWLRTPPDSIAPLVLTDPNFTGDGHRHTNLAAAGFPYGRGRIVVGADPDLLRNDALRVCKYALDVPAVRMLEYLRERGGPPRRTLVFDEYRQGYGNQRGSTSTIAAYLGGTGSGRLLLQLLGAGLVLLAAVAPRMIPPRDPETIERRSPLEHVDALGRAYAQVGATRSATARLLRGLRRRLAGGAIRPGIDASDDAFLDRAQRDAPQCAGEVAAIRAALRSPVSRGDFTAVGAALEKLELTLTRT